MPRKKIEKIQGLAEKIEYLGLDLDKIPDILKRKNEIEYRVQKSYEEKKYVQYRYVPVKDIQILLSPTNRLDSLSEKYKKARPLSEYLDKDNEENILKYTTFLNMLKNVDIAGIEEVEKEQNSLNKKIPFKVKFHGNYLWQIYYSEISNKYFMIVPTEDTDYSTFFYLLKKQLQGKRNDKIFVPISGIKYSNNILKRSEIEELENYLWLFTKDWASIYEVYNKKDELSIQIIGETEIYEKIKTTYKVELKNNEEANDFYKLLKALFILQTELPMFYNFETNINKDGKLELNFEGQTLEYKNMVTFIREQYKEGLKKRKEYKSKIRIYNKKLKQLQELIGAQEIEYLAKEKQISTFLECKKTFFGKFKYYFKYNKKRNKQTKDDETSKDIEIGVAKKEQIKNTVKKERKKIPIKKVYTLDELITSYKELEQLENQMKNLLMDVNALKLKSKNLDKKIENASKYIEEIDNHKKSIFEFWKYSNKDEVSVLPEGEQEEVNIIKKIEKTFDYNEDLESFGKKLDKIQRKNLNRAETDSIFIATTNTIDILNKIKTKDVELEDIEKFLKEKKKEIKKLKTLTEEEYDIFGNLIQDKTKIKKINNQSHRELEKDEYSILEINNTMKTAKYRMNLMAIIDDIEKVLKRIVIPESLPVYKATNKNELDKNEINVFNINPEKEIEEAINLEDNDINLYKLNVKEGTKGVGFTNIIFYDNKNRTLPVGMDLSTKMIINTSDLELNLVKQKSFKKLDFINDKDDFTDIKIRNINVYEYEILFNENVK